MNIKEIDVTNGGFTLFGIPGNKDTDLARHEVMQLEVEFTEIACPESTSEWYRLPFVRDDDGRRYFGMDSIRSFVLQRKKGGF